MKQINSCNIIIILLITKMSTKNLSSLVSDLQKYILESGNLLVDYDLNDLTSNSSFTVSAITAISEEKNEVILHLSLLKFDEGDLYIKMSQEKYNKFKEIYDDAVGYKMTTFHMNGGDPEYLIENIKLKLVKYIPKDYISKDNIFYYQNTKFKGRENTDLYESLIYALFNGYMNDNHPGNFSNNKYEVKKSNHVTVNFGNKMLGDFRYKFDIQIFPKSTFYLDNITDNLDYIDMLYDFYYTFEKLVDKEEESHKKGEDFGDDYYFLTLKK